MRVDRRDRSHAVVSSADVNQTQDASMKNASDNDQFAKVLVERHDGLMMFGGVHENREVSWIVSPVGDRLGMMAGVGNGDLR